MATIRGITVDLVTVDSLSIDPIIYKKTNKYVSFGRNVQYITDLLLIANFILGVLKFMWEIQAPSYISIPMIILNGLTSVIDYFYVYDDYITLKNLLDIYEVDEFEYRQFDDEHGAKNAKSQLRKKLKEDRIVILNIINRRELFKPRNI